jgi:hypothetical protein
VSKFWTADFQIHFEAIIYTGASGWENKIIWLLSIFYFSNWMHNQFKTYIKIHTKMVLHISVNKPSSGSLLPCYAKVTVIEIIVMNWVRSRGCIIIHSYWCVCCARFKLRESFAYYFWRNKYLLQLNYFNVKIGTQ